MMRRYGDLVASAGEFFDDEGRTVKRWLKCGVVMRDDRSGALSIKLDTVPVRPDWSGWLAVRNINGDRLEDGPEPRSMGTPCREPHATTCSTESEAQQ